MASATPQIALPSARGIFRKRRFHAMERQLLAVFVRVDGRWEEKHQCGSADPGAP